jgi:hypothetical protein
MTSDPRFTWTRRRFLTGTLLGTAISFAGYANAQPATTAADTAQRKPPKPPPLPDDLVKEFVGAAHGNLERTREMLGNEPGLLNATWDWKAGDFETAIGGAGHMGRRDIAEYLIAQGARMDLFVAAMLGELPIVRAYLEAHPALLHSKGPHGISLVAHARAGAARAAETLAWLESQTTSK